MTTLPKAIFFDMDGTLVDYQTGMEEHWREACANGCTGISLDPDKLYEAIVTRRTWFWDDEKLSATGRMDLDAASRAIVEYAFADLGEPQPEIAASIAREYRTNRITATVCYPGAIDLLETIRTRGIRTALITNGAAHSQRHTIERCDLARYFDCIVIEGEFGCGKPDERVFRHALTACGVEPDVTWMVGDYHAADIVTPHRLGMHTVWIDEPGAGLPTHAKPAPHRVIRSVAELMDL